MGWYAVIPALLLTLSPGAYAADHPEEAVRDLARKIVAFAGPREAVAFTFRSIPPAPAAEAAHLRRLLESALRDANARLDPAAPIDVRVTLSENATARLLIAEARRGDDRLTSIASWPLPPASAAGPAPGLRLDRKLLWEQPDPILDVAISPDSLLVLSPSKLALLTRLSTGWEEKQSVAVTLPRPWPRDPRGRLSLTSAGLRLYLPGAVCTGSTQPSLALDCRVGDEPWPIDSGRYLLLAHYAPARNYFEGRVTTQAGARKSVAPFYTAAAIEEAGDVLWVLAGVDGRALLLDRNFAQTAVLAARGLAAWGSDIAGAGVRCGATHPLLVTRPGDDSEALQAFTIANRQAEALSAPLPMPGPVTALWPAPEGVLAVVRDPNTEKYAAYLVTIACGQ